MAAPDPYAGIASERFTMSDWKEWVRLVSPSGTGTITRGNVELHLTGHIPEERKIAAWRTFLGWDAVSETAPKLLLRSNPVRHPEIPMLFCTGITCQSAVPNAASAATLKHPPRYALGGSDAPSAVLPGFSGYKKSLTTLHFQALPYPVREDAVVHAPDHGEWERNVTWNLEPKVEFLELTNIMAFAEGENNTAPLSNPKGKPFTAPWAQILVKPDLVAVWDNVPSGWIETSTFYPPKLIAGLGKVNKTDWLASLTHWYPAGTLLFLGARITRTVNALWAVRDDLVAAIASEAVESAFNLRVEMFFSYFNPPKGKTSDAEITTNLGHNNAPWFNRGDGGLILSGDENSGKWFLTTTTGESGALKLLGEYDFKNLFDSYQNPTI